MQSTANPEANRTPEVVPVIRHTVPWRVTSVTPLPNVRLRVTFVDRIEGDPGNVIGLSLPLLRRLLAQLDGADHRRRDPGAHRGGQARQQGHHLRQLQRKWRGSPGHPQYVRPVHLGCPVPHLRRRALRAVHPDALLLHPLRQPARADPLRVHGDGEHLGHGDARRPADPAGRAARRERVPPGRHLRETGTATGAPTGGRFPCAYSPLRSAHVRNARRRRLVSMVVIASRP